MVGWGGVGGGVGGIFRRVKMLNYDYVFSTINKNTVCAMSHLGGARVVGVVELGQPHKFAALLPAGHALRWREGGREGGGEKEIKAAARFIKRRKCGGTG